MRSFCTAVALLVCVCLRPLSAQSVFCESDGQCQQTNKCRADELEECYSDSGYVEYPSTSGNVACTSSGTRPNITLKDLTVKYIHINPTYVKICLNWSLFDSSSSSGGYKVKLFKNNNKIWDYCIGEVSQTSTCINHIAYESLGTYRIEVLPHPLNDDDAESYFKKSVSLDGDIRGCAAAVVQQKSSVCVERYDKPRNVSVISSVCEDGMKTLKVSWNHLDSMPIPDAYFVEINYASKTHYFKVINATQVLVRNLSEAMNYSVKVRAYRHCSGLGVYDFDEDTIGCGLGGRNPVPEMRLQDLCPSATTTTVGYGTASSITGENPTITVQRIATKTALTTVLSIVCALLIVVIILVIVTLGRFLVFLRKNSKVSPVGLARADFRVFLFSSPSVSRARLEHIHNHITANLVKYYSIVTMDELTGGDMSKWLEQTVNSVDLVLIVANKEFLNDWQSVSRPPELYCMESLISAAVIQDTITKFAFISMENSMNDVCLPENSYLKLMQVFLMGTRANQEAELYQFVTKSRGILVEV